MNKIETILHPVRFKIIQKFLDGQSKTVKVLANELKNVPQATLYRQLDTLVKSDVLTITDEIPIRGTVEKVYSLNRESANISNIDLKGLTKEEHLQYFMFFLTQLSGDFETYLQKEDIDYEKDGVGYRQVALHLTDEEFLDFTRDLAKVFSKYLEITSADNRTKRIFSNIVMPEYKEEMDNER